MQIEKYTKAAVALGSTSALALAASADLAKAEGLYIGAFAGTTFGSNPSPGDSDEDYQLSGPIGGFFAGIDVPMADGMFVGAEVALTGPTEGDADDEASDEYAYDIAYNVDANIRIGRTFDNIDVYGLGGVSFGSVSGCCYGTDYGYYGANIGVGAQYNVNDRFFVGAQYIHRFTTGVFENENGYSADHGALTVRAGVRF